MKPRLRLTVVCITALTCGSWRLPAWGQNIVIVAPPKPVAINAYALVNTTVADSTNNPTSTGGRGHQIVAGGPGLCCGSLIGLSGAADFGSGLGGVFQVETGFALNTGQLDNQRQIFGRQAYVGFTSQIGKTFNIVSVGRQYGVTFISTSPVDPYSHGEQIFTAWDCGLFGVRYDNSIEDVFTVGKGKILFQYSPGGVAGNKSSGTTVAGGGVYELKSSLLVGTVDHSEDAANRSMNVYGGGARYEHKNLSLFGYGFAVFKDPDFGDNGGGIPAADGTTEPLANTSLAPNLGNKLQRKDRLGNVAVRYDLKKEYALIGMYKFDSAKQVNSLGQHGTQSTISAEIARGISNDFFVYGYVGYTKLTGAELKDPNSPNGSFAGASDRTYVGVGLNYRFSLALK